MNLDFEEKGDRPSPKPKTKNSTTPVLDNFSRDLVRLAELGKLDPAIGREKETNRIAQILSRRKKNNPIVLGPAGCGKCLGKGTKILMYDGSLKKVEDIEIGDQLMGVDSTPRNVLNLGRGKSNMFKITQKSGMEYRVNDAHILSLKASGNRNNANTGKIINIGIEDYLKLSKSHRRNLKGWKVNGVEFPTKELPLDPYFLGVWLGDGHSAGTLITKPDYIIQEYIQSYAKSFGLETYNTGDNDITTVITSGLGVKINRLDVNGNYISTHPSATEFVKGTEMKSDRIFKSLDKDALIYGFKWEKAFGSHNKILSHLQSLNLIKNKHIPEIYLYNSRENRLKLLAGLLDTDGYLHNNVYEISQKNKLLAEHIIFLSRSLGFKANFNKDKVVRGVTYKRMSISGNNLHELPLKIERKKCHYSSDFKNRLVTGIKITEDGYDDYYGFNIDGDHLFILEDFTVTHNTAIIENLAIKIYEGDCPKNLVDKRIVALDLTSVVAGTKYRGQFEERIKAILTELLEVDNVILFIDEIHTIIGTGNSSGALDASNILKPALARGELQCIGATTLDEYRENIEKDGALERRFLKVLVDPPTPAQTLEILKQLKNKYENFHKVKYTDEALNATVILAERYITDREFPDKAFDILDEVGAKKQLNIKFPKEIEDLKIKHQEIKEEKMEVVKSQLYEQAAQLRDKEKKIVEQLQKAKDAWEKEQKSNRVPVTEEDVYEMIGEMTNIPVTRLNKDEAKSLLNLEEQLKKSVIGQDIAVEKMARAIRRSRVGIKDHSKPLGSFICVGQTGVGKSFLAKMLAKEIFGSADALIRVDMSEYMEKHAVSKMIGSPPGYIGHDEGGQLTEQVKNKPYCVILFDEIEKAHRDTFNVLLQVLDDGHLTDSRGRKVNFKNTLIIMTSNLGAKKVQDFGDGMGFRTQAKIGQSNEVAKTIIQKELKNKFNPEFLNRIDDIIIFNNLKEEDIKKIVTLEIEKLNRRLVEKKYKITFEESTIDYIAKNGYDEKYGARPLKRAIQEKIEDFLSEEILKETIKEEVPYLLGISPDGEVKLTLPPKPKKTKNS